MHALGLTILLAAGVVPNAQVGVRLAGEARAPDAFATAPGGPGGELTVTPSIDTWLQGDRFRLRLGYSLEMGWQTEALQPTPDLLHEGRLTYTTRLSPRLELSASAWGRAGTETWLLSLTQSPTTVDLLPQVGRIQVAAATGSAGLRYRTSPTQTISLTLGYDASGGLDTPSRAVLPLYYGPTGRLAIRQRIGPLDEVGGNVTASHTELSIGSAYDLLGLAGVWRHDLGPRTRIVPLVGVVVARDARVLDVLPPANLYPQANVDIEHRFVFSDSELAVVGRVWLGPAVNRIDGTLESRAGLSASVAWRLGRRFTAGLGTDEIWVLARNPLVDGGLQSVAARAAWTLATGMRIETGLRFYSQQLPTRSQLPVLLQDGWAVTVGFVATIGTEPTPPRDRERDDRRRLGSEQ